MRTKTMLLSIFLNFTACEFEAADAPPPDDPSVSSGIDAGSACVMLDPDYCVSGYTKEISADGNRVFCMHVLGCPTSRNPCMRGTPYGNATDAIFCDGAKP